MLFGERLLAVRKKQKLSQEYLAKAIGAHAPVIGRYERGEVKPSIEVAYKLAKVLSVSLDFLVGNTEIELDSDLLQKIIDIQQLKKEDKGHLMYTIDAMLRDAKTRQAYAS